jgi:hypothetical protein
VGEIEFPESERLRFAEIAKKAEAAALDEGRAR